MVSEQDVPFVTMRVTVCGPDELNAWVGFCNTERLAAPEPGSPKFHDQEVMAAPPLTVLSSVKVMAAFTQVIAPWVNAASGLTLTVTANEDGVPDPQPLVPFTVTKPVIAAEE